MLIPCGRLSVIILAVSGPNDYIYTDYVNKNIQVAYTYTHQITTNTKGYIHYCDSNKRKLKYANRDIVM